MRQLCAFHLAQNLVDLLHFYKPQKIYCTSNSLAMGGKNTKKET